MGIIRGLLIAVLFVAPLVAQESMFHNKAQVALAAGNIALGVADAVQSCRPGFVEVTLPTQSCAGKAAFILGGKAAETAGQYWLYRKGHRRLAWMVPVVGIGATGYAIGYSFRW